MDQQERRQLSAQIVAQMAGAMAGIGTEAVSMMTETGAPHIVIGTSVGERAGRIAEYMAKANTARRVQDVDGYRRALRRAAALILGALVEIGEEPNAIEAEQQRRDRGRVAFADTEAGRSHLANLRRGSIAAGTGDEIEPDVCEFQAGQTICVRLRHTDANHTLIDPFVSMGGPQQGET